MIIIYGVVLYMFCYDFCHRKFLFFLESEGEPVFVDFLFGEDFVFGECALSLRELLFGGL